MGVFLAFAILLTLTFTNQHQLKKLIHKSREDWILDTVGLCFQGIIIPLLQITVISQIYNYLLPNYHNYWNLHPILAFILSFVLVDYLYYWNHRLLHSRTLWRLHLVHHTVTEMQVLGTSRNTLWTSFFIIYLWVNGLFIYLLKDPSWYVAGVTLTCALDLWRHSAIAPAPNSLLYRLISSWLILPQDHAWHHADHGCNYGANFKFWDMLHGSYYRCGEAPNELGIKSNLSIYRKLFFPFGGWVLFFNAKIAKGYAKGAKVIYN